MALDPKASVALLSVASNTVLVVGKLAVGILIGSVSVISEAIHSSVDLLAAIIAFVAVRTSGRPADDSHAFGHGKYENLSGAVEALLIFVAALWIIWEAVEKLRHPAPMEAPLWGVGIMAVSCVANLFVSRKLFEVGRRTESMALLADAWHLRTDIYTSLGVLGGLLLITLGQWLLPGRNLYWLDPVVAMAVALLICKAAWDLTRDAVRDLLDSSLPEGERERVQRQVFGEFPQVLSFHRLRTRRGGAQRFVDFHMVVAHDMSVEASHHLADRVSARIQEVLPNASVVPHVEPCMGACSEACLGGCTLAPEERSRARIRGALQSPPPGAQESPE